MGSGDRPETSADQTRTLFKRPEAADDYLTAQASAALGHDTVLTVLERLFPPPKEVRFRAIRPGYSGACVLLVEPRLASAGRQLECVVKIDSAAQTERELRAWRENVEPYVPNRNLPGIHQSLVVHEDGNDFGAIAYQFFAERTLNQETERLSNKGDTRGIEKLLEGLLNVIDNAWNVDRAQVRRDIFQDDYPLTDEELKAFEQFCKHIPEPLRPAEDDVRLIRAIWRAQPPPAARNQLVSRCHGDLHGDNVLLDGSSFCLIDFTHTRVQHFLRDFVTLECDLVVRLAPSGDLLNQGGLGFVQTAANLGCPSENPSSFSRLPGLGRIQPEMADVLSVLRVLRKRAWAKMENTAEEIANYQIGLIGRLTKMATWTPTDYSEEQRYVAALKAVAHARSLANNIEYSVDFEDKGAKGANPAGSGRPATLNDHSSLLPIAEKVSRARNSYMESGQVPFLLIGGVYLDVMLDPVRTKELRANEWSNLEQVELRLGGSCLQVGRSLYELYDIQSVLFSAIGGAGDALSREAQRLLDSEGWIAKNLSKIDSGASTAISFHLVQGNRSFTSVFTHKGALENLGWSDLYQDILAEVDHSGVLYIAGYFRTRLYSRLDRNIGPLSEQLLVVLDHGRLVPEADSADAITSLKTAFARGHVDVYICTLAELWSLVKYPQRRSLPKLEDRSIEMVEDLARNIHLPPITIVRDADWPGSNSALILFSNESEMVTVPFPHNVTGGDVGADNVFNAAFVHGLTHGPPDANIRDVVSDSASQGVNKWVEATWLAH